MKLLLFALLLPLTAAESQPRRKDGFFLNGGYCDDVKGLPVLESREYPPILDGDYYKRCVRRNGTVVPEIVGCRSAFNDGAMLKLGEERKEEYDDAPGYEEKCEQGKDAVTYSSTVLKSRKDAAADKHCTAARGSKEFVVDRVVLKCRYEGEKAVVEVVACEHWYGNGDPLFWMGPTRIPINQSKTIGDKSYKCVKHGAVSAKLLHGEIERCENKEGAKIIEGNAYKRCVLENNEYRIDVVGCVREIAHNYTGILGFEYTLVGGYAERDVDGTIMKCVKEGNTAKFVTGSVDECDNRGEEEFIVGNVYKRCIREGDNFRTEVVACVARFEGPLKILNKFGYFVEKVTFDSVITFTIHGMTAQLKCVRRNDTAVVIAGDLTACENRTIGEEFLDKSLYKVCKIENELYRSEVVGCQRPSGKKLGVGAAVTNLERFEYCLKEGNSARLLTGEEAMKKIEEMNNPSLKTPESNNTNPGVSGAVLIRDLKLCKNRTLRVEFLDQSLYKVCRIENFMYTSEVVGCYSSLASIKLYIGRGVTVDNEYNFCEKYNGSARLLIGEIAKKKTNEAEKFNVTNHGIEHYQVPVSRDISCFGQKIDHVFALKGVVYQCAMDAWGSNRGAKPVGCVSVIRQYGDDSFIPFGVRKELKRDVYQTCNVPTQTSIRVDFEIRQYEQSEKDIFRYFNYMDLVMANLKAKNLTKACYFNGRQINKDQSAFINDFAFTCAERDLSRLEVQFAGCFSEGAPANVGVRMRSRNIAQCDFSKIKKDAEMIIVSS